MSIGCLIISSTVVVCDWCISILAVVVNDWRILILNALTRSCSLTSPLWYQLTVVLFDRRHPPFWNSNSAIPIDIVRVKSNVNGFFNPTGVPMWVSLNNFTLRTFEKVLYIILSVNIHSRISVLGLREAEPTCFVLNCVIIMLQSQLQV